jgi:hypothetical protein
MSSFLIPWSSTPRRFKKQPVTRRAVKQAQLTGRVQRVNFDRIQFVIGCRSGCQRHEFFVGSLINTRISTLPRSIPKDLFHRHASSMSSLNWVVGPSCAMPSVSESGTARWCGGMCASMLQHDAWSHDSGILFLFGSSARRSARQPTDLRSECMRCQ